MNKLVCMHCLLVVVFLIAITACGLETQKAGPHAPAAEEGMAPTFEAEDGEVLGSAEPYRDKVLTDIRGMAYIYRDGDGVKFSNSPAGSSITVRYASINTGAISVYINGESAGKLSFTASGDWNGKYNDASMDVEVPEGATIEFRFEPGDAALNFDYIVVK